MEGNMRRTRRATWLFLISMAALGGLYGPGCSNEAEDLERNGEAPGAKGQCAPADDDGDPCTAEGCKGGGNEHVIVAGLACGMNNRLACNAEGKCAGCTNAADCGESTECAPWACDNGVCALTFTNPGTPVQQQVPGDCMRVQCTGTGEEQAVADELDVPVVVCQIGMCSGGTPSTTPAAEGTECNENGGKACDGKGKCVECITDSDCGQIGWFCDPKFGSCHRCDDGLKNGDETDVDCGGYDCAKCNQGLECAVGSDCKTNFCADGICCDTACNAACEACNLPSLVGTCDLVPKYGEDTAFGNGMSCTSQDKLACTGAGSCKNALNAPCVGNQDCASLKCAAPGGVGQKVCLKNTGDVCASNAECFNNTCTNGLCAP